MEIFLVCENIDLGYAVIAGYHDKGEADDHAARLNQDEADFYWTAYGAPRPGQPTYFVEEIAIK